MNATSKSPAAERQLQYRQGVATQLREIRAAVEALNDAIATLLAESKPEHEERPR